jgi:hypothetical protein
MEKKGQKVRSGKGRKGKKKKRKNRGKLAP